jgi:hypothetical protein
MSIRERICFDVTMYAEPSAVTSPTGPHPCIMVPMFSIIDEDISFDADVIIGMLEPIGAGLSIPALCECDVACEDPSGAAGIIDDVTAPPETNSVKSTSSPRSVTGADVFANATRAFRVTMASARVNAHTTFVIIDLVVG